MSKISNKKIYGVVICYNSAPVIKELYERIDKKFFDKIYFFDDNSTDNSYEIAKLDWQVVKNQLVGLGKLKKSTKNGFC